MSLLLQPSFYVEQVLPSNLVSTSGRAELNGLDSKQYFPITKNLLLILYLCYFFIVPEVPSESRWTSPIRKHISCPPDPSSTSNTMSIAYVVGDIGDVYENLVVRIISDLLLDGPNAPFYRSLIETGLGTGFSPSSGLDFCLALLSFLGQNS